MGVGRGEKNVFQKKLSESLVQMDTKKALERKIKETLYTM